MDTKKLCDEIVEHMNKAEIPKTIHFEKDEFGTVQIDHEYEIERAFSFPGRQMTDWRRMIPETIRAEWETFSHRQMLMLRKHFNDLLIAEHASWLKE